MRPPFHSFVFFLTFDSVTASHSGGDILYTDQAAASQIPVLHIISRGPHQAYCVCWTA